MLDGGYIDPWADNDPFAKKISPKDLLVGLNDEQVRAVITTEGPLLIQAGAGSGKTKTLTHRIAYIIAKNLAKPHNILAVTFTNKAAREMRERVALLLGESAENRSFMPYMGTFHSICVRLLRKDGEQIGLSRNFVIFDDGDQMGLVKRIMKDQSIDDKQYNARTVLSLISSAKNELVTPAQYAGTASSPAQKVAAKVYPLYQKALKDAAAMDFDDLIGKTVDMLAKNDDIAARWREQFKYILIDEYQDTNAAQYKLVKLLTGQSKNICVVGDDWQCLVPGSLVETAEGPQKIENIRKGTVVKVASGYGRSSASVVTAKKKFAHKGEMVRIRTASGKELLCTPNHLLFARWKKTEAYLVYLMYFEGKGYRIGAAKGIHFDGKRGDIGLRARANQEHADRMWVLKVCSDRQEAIYYEVLTAYKYGIPMTIFHAFANRAMQFSQKYIDDLYKEIDTHQRAKELMADKGLAFDYPHFLPGAASRNSRKRANVNIVLFGDKRASAQRVWSASRLSINTTDPDDLKIFKKLGYAIRPGRAGTYRTEVHSLDYGKIESIAEEARAGVSGSFNLTRYSFMTDKKFHFMPAGQLHHGMLVPILAGERIIDDEVVSVARETYSGDVYDLEIDKVHNYVAEGVVVHNSIYSWRGADFRNILNFEHDYPGSTVIKLEQNYRSTKHILDAAHAVITKNQQRSDKKLWTAAGEGREVQVVQVANERAEAEAIIRRIKIQTDMHARNYRDFAILYRTNAQSRNLEEQFVRYGVPYKIVGGTKFYDRKEIKDLVAYLRLIYQPEDIVSFQRIVNVPTRGIGTKSVDNFLRWKSINEYSLLQAFQYVDECKDLTPRARKALGELGDVLVALREYSEETTVASLMDGLLKRLEYMQFLDDGSPQADSRIENVRELISVAKAYQDMGLSGFLEEVALVSDADTMDSSGNAVTLMTLHAAKGLEFPVVFMTGMEETIFPHSRALYDQFEMEEERRLCYVGMTRAREELTMIYATSRMLYGGVQHNVPSRFLSEIDAEMRTEDGGSAFGGLTYANTSDDNPFQQAQAARASNEPRYVPDINEGDAIKHPVFGQGTVMELEGDVATIYFRGKGAKKLNIAFAPIEKL